MVSSLNNLNNVSISNQHLLVLKNNGDIFATGNNSYGQLGSGTTSSLNLPNLIATTCTLSNDIFSSITKISLSPNPTNSSLNIESQETVKSIKIIDLLGRKTNITNFENNKIDVSNLQNGVYFLEIATDSGSQVQKFIKN